MWALQQGTARVDRPTDPRSEAPSAPAPITYR
jgi:hypothetical protein